VHNKALGAARVEKLARLHNKLLTSIDPVSYPLIGRPYQPDTVVQAVGDGLKRGLTLSPSDADLLVEATAGMIREIGERAPAQLLKLTEAVETVTLEAMIAHIGAARRRSRCHDQPGDRLIMSALPDQLAALATMSPVQLRIEWRRVYQAPPSSRLTPDLLRRGIAYRLQERIHGGLPTHIAREIDRLAKRKLADMAAAAAAGAAGAATTSATRAGASVAGASGDGSGARGSTRDSIAARRVDEPRLRPGTRLVRSWQGRTYSVLVTEHVLAAWVAA
jgi:hypothetical protein